jgi:beta-1,4-mannosyl-glycoprotein beta-1,4-N-acetylglucosaminyltransferase
MTVDCFPFFNEVALLEARLHELAPVVDRFVICEGTRTFSGQPKPLWLSECREVYAPFADRVDHLVMDTYAGLDLTDAWALEHAQKQVALDHALALMQPGDLLLYTDADEIPKAEAVRRFARSAWPIATLEMPLFYYYLNCRAQKPWRLAKILRWDGAPLTHRQIRRRHHPAIHDAGWHFSFLGDPGRIKAKLDAYPHTEYARPPWNTVEYIADQVRRRADLFGRAYQFEVIPTVDHLPAYIREHLPRYQEHLCV